MPRFRESIDPARLSVAGPAESGLRVAILGGGIAGMVLTDELASANRFTVELIEKNAELGGLLRSVELGGLAYDIGYFLFPDTHGIFRAFPDLLPHFLHGAICEVSIRDGGFQDSYPVTLGGYLRQFGARRTIRAFASLAAGKVCYWNDHTLPGWIKYYLGSVFYYDSGLKSYIERLYCASDAGLGLEFAHQRLQKIVERSSLRYVTRQLQQALRALPRGSAAGRKILALVRPREGWPWVHASIRSTLEQHGVSVFTNQRLLAIHQEPGGFRLCFPDHQRFYHRVISTLPIPSVCELLGIQLSAGFEYVSLISLFYRFRGRLGFAGSHLFNFTHEGRWKRAIVFSQVYGAVNGDHYLTVEVTVRDSEEALPERLGAEFVDHVRKLSVFDGQFYFEGWALTEHAYPFFRAGDDHRIEMGRAMVEQAGIECVGRQGTFRYLNSSRVVLEAQQAANRMSGTMGGEAETDHL